MAKKTSPSVSDMSAPVVTGKAGLSNGLKIALFVSLIIAFTLGYIAISLTIQDDVDLVWRIVTPIVCVILFLVFTTLLSRSFSKQSCPTSAV
jgi:uncharacterized membrane protein YoaK (UPF0700 family)